MLFLRSREWRYVGFCLLILMMGLAFAFTRPLGEMALNDDWLYARMVRDLDLSTFKPDTFIVSVFVGQWGYAKILTFLFGFHLTLLRLSTFFLAVIAILCLYRMVVFRLGVRMSLIICLGLLFHPLFYHLSLSFMTDIPAFVCILLGLIFYWYWWESPRLSLWWLAQFLTLYGSFIRQNYFVFFAASVFLLLFHPNKVLRKISLVYGFIPGCFLLLGLHRLFSVWGWWPVNIISFHVFQDWSLLLRHACQQLFFVWQYLGFFLCPLLILSSSSWSKRERFFTIFFAIAGILVNIFLLKFHGLSFPFFSNTWTEYGIGVRSDVLSGVLSTELSWGVRLFLTSFAGAASGGLMVCLFIAFRHWIRRSREESVSHKGFEVFLLVAILGEMGFVLFFRSFDRYYLSFFLPAYFLFIHSGLRRPSRSVAVYLAAVWVGCLVILSVAGTRTYFSLSRVKWLMANKLVQEGVPVSNIDGGYEWLGWHWYGNGDPKILPYYNPQVPWYITTLMPDVQREYVISYSATLEGYRLVRSYPYEGFFGHEQSLFLLKRIE